MSVLASVEAVVVVVFKVVLGDVDETVSSWKLAFLLGFFLLINLSSSLSKAATGLIHLSLSPRFSAGGASSSILACDAFFWYAAVLNST